MSYTSLNYHIMFATKNRQRWITPELKARLVPYMGGIVRSVGGAMAAADGDADHMHVAATLKPTVVLASVVGVLKSKSSGWIHQTFPQLPAFDWQDGYSAFSVSPSVMPRLLEYIRGQEEHHRKVSFKEELKEFLEKHGIEFDERYLD